MQREICLNFGGSSFIFFGGIRGVAEFSGAGS